MSLYCLGFISPFYTDYQSFLTCQQEMMGTFIRQRNLAAPGILVVTLTKCLQWTLGLWKRWSFCLGGSPARCTRLTSARWLHMRHPLKIFKEGVPSTRDPLTLSIPFNCLFFLCRIGHSLIHHICLLAYVACASLEWKPHGGRDLGWVMAVYLEKSVTYCRRSRDPFE